MIKEGKKGLLRLPEAHALAEEMRHMKEIREGGHRLLWDAWAVEGGGVAVNQVLEAEWGCSVSLLRFGKALENWTLTSLYCNRWRREAWVISKCLLNPGHFSIPRATVTTFVLTAEFPCFSFTHKCLTGIPSSSTPLLPSILHIIAGETFHKYKAFVVFCQKLFLSPSCL